MGNWESTGKVVVGFLKNSATTSHYFYFFCIKCLIKFRIMFCLVYDFNFSQRAQLLTLELGKGGRGVFDSFELKIQRCQSCMDR